MTQPPPLDWVMVPGPLHTKLLETLTKELQRQHPGAFHEDSDSDLVIKIDQGGTRVPSYVKIDVSSLAEEALKLAAPTPQAPDAGLRKALAGLLTFFSPRGEDANERFERIAAEFYRDTGMLAPGKSEPMEMDYQGRDQERRERYDRWVAERVVVAREALSAVPTVDVGGDSSSNASRAAQGITALLPPAPLSDGGER